MQYCNHKWVAMEDGTNDKFCVKCSNKAKQAVMSLDINVNINTETDIKVIHQKLTEHFLKQLYKNGIRA